jgi:hypothetical protein
MIRSPPIAHVTITVFHSDRDPVGRYHVTVAARRTKHLRFNDLSDPVRWSPLSTEPHLVPAEWSREGCNHEKHRMTSQEPVPFDRDADGVRDGRRI